MKKPESKIEGMIEDLARAVARGFAEQDKKIEALTKFTINGFAESDKRFDRVFIKLSGHDQKFAEHDKRFDKLEKDNAWVKDVLEKQTGTLARLDQERIFSLSYIQRLEADVNRIKKQLKIA